MSCGKHDGIGHALVGGMKVSLCTNTESSQRSYFKIEKKRERERNEESNVVETEIHSS